MVFKAYDIRGKYKEQIDYEFAYSLGVSLGEKYKNVLVGNDVRIGSKELVKPFIWGLLDMGSKVYYAGTISTPKMYYGTKGGGYDLGVILTASHNPKEYTGFKVCDNNVVPLSPIEDIKPNFSRLEMQHTKIEEIKNTKILDIPDINFDPIEDYEDYHVKKFKNSFSGEELNNLSIAVDFANGATTLAEKNIITRLFGNYNFINECPDGNFPAHEPDTLKEECLEQIKDTTEITGSNIGLIFDGDGDRLGLIDEEGNTLKGDIITAIIAEQIIKDINLKKIDYPECEYECECTCHPINKSEDTKDINDTKDTKDTNNINNINNTDDMAKKIVCYTTKLTKDGKPCINTPKIVYDLRCSNIVPELVKKHDAEAIKTRVGHYFIKKLMHEIDADFAGEFSNHFYFKEIGYFESPLLALKYVVEAMTDNNMKLSELAKQYEVYYHSGEINFKLIDKIAQEKTIETIKDHFKDCKIETIDGISIYCNDWWFNLRASNTEPLLRLNLEAKSKKQMNDKVNYLKSLII
ncbi:phosphomannomutase/phosphoglucomutase [Methanococcus voltae]|uniref:Phosphoglucomutase/phosphomannomutase alpha/beta/alpha domain I n=1 Tax=Methanococcus voltae (strain ATCC BAA-1334 / A3) TaxID=456320 RepID=D7DT38_METV3|nr:phosphomannomutase/phosphoglucomutase [Methanococcus voltae]MCS3901846.1 phosphomannomutase [Methanococcus voltae]